MLSLARGIYLAYYNFYYYCEHFMANIRQDSVRELIKVLSKIEGHTICVEYPYVQCSFQCDALSIGSFDILCLS